MACLQMSTHIRPKQSRYNIGRHGVERIEALFTALGAEIAGAEGSGGRTGVARNDAAGLGGSLDAGGIEQKVFRLEELLWR